jgi:hypothetical protein
VASSVFRSAVQEESALFVKNCRFDHSELGDWSSITFRLKLDGDTEANIITHSTKCKKCDTEYYHIDESQRNFFLKQDASGNLEMHCTECESPMSVIAESVFVRDFIREYFDRHQIFYPDTTTMVKCPRCEQVPEVAEFVPNSDQEFYLKAKRSEIALKGELFSDSGRLTPDIARNLKRLTRVVYSIGMRPRMEHAVPLNIVTRETHIPTGVLREEKAPKFRPPD